VRNKIGYDLNSLLRIANFCVCAITVILYYNMGDNRYVDVYTLILLCLFAVENFLMLLYEKKKRDPFVLILIILTIVFYMGRVLTLLYDPWSNVFFRSQFTLSDLHYSLIFIMISNALIFLGLIIGAIKGFHKKIILADKYPANPFNVSIILLIVILINFSGILPIWILGRFVNYIIGVFIRLDIILLSTLIYIIINYEKISIRYRIIILTLIVIYIIFHTLVGSRSALLSIAIFLLCGSLAVKGSVRFNKKFILISLIIIPFFIIFFILATYIRQVCSNRTMLSTQQVIILKELPVIYSRSSRSLYRPIFDRIGFLDYAADMIKNSEQYSKIINFRYYFESIVDNVLTPGFNIFGSPRVSHSISYIARGEAVPTHEFISAAYHSDMPTAYGEYYVLFHGYPALIILFIFSYIFKRIYQSVRSEDIFLFCLYRALILFVFYLWLNSFGMDWILLDLIGIFITVHLSKNFYKMKRATRTYLLS